MASVYDCESCNNPMNNCACSQTEVFPPFDMTATGRRSSAMSGLLTAPQNIGGAFENSSTNMQICYTSDPRVEEDMFPDISPMGTSAPSTSRIPQEYFGREHNPSAISMSRARSANHRAMSTSGYPTQDRAPVRPLFAAQVNGSPYDYAYSGSHITSVATNVYRDTPQASPSFTESSVSRGARSQRSSNASYNHPPTPQSDYDGQGFEQLNMGGSPTGPFYAMGGGQFPMSQSYSPTERAFSQGSAMTMAPPQSQPMSKTNSSRSQPKEKKFWCDVANCAHGRAFGTRNDLDRHKLAVHKIVSTNSNTKVFVCQGFSCVQQGKSKIWPRKDNFKNHCKVAHTESDVDDLINRSERLASFLTPQELEGLAADDNVRPCSSVPPDQAKQNGNSNLTPALRISIAPVSRVHQRNSNTLPCPSPDHLSPIDGHRHSMSRHLSMQRSPSATSGRNDATIQQHSHHRSFSTPNAPGMLKSASYPSASSQPARSSTDAKAFDVDEVKEFLLQNNAPAHMLQALCESSRGVKRQLEEEQRSPNRRYKCTFDKCDKAFKRACDLKKHKTRHTKPWGCTDSSCHKVFGSKNDWKRHELSRHFQNTSWICGEYDSSNAVNRCLVNCPSAKKFAEHLRNDHSITDEDVIKEKQKSRHIGRNWAVAVWCGFCKQILQLTRENQDAWNERFDHIDSHLNGTFVPTEKQLKEDPGLSALANKEQSILQWFPPNSDKPKGELPIELEPEQIGVMATGKRAAAAAADDDKDDLEEEEEEEDDDDVEGSDDDSDDSPPASGLIDPSVLMQSPTKRRRVVWYCSACNHGPHDERRHDSCSDCGVPRSPTARQEDGYDSDDQ